VVSLADSLDHRLRLFHPFGMRLSADVVTPVKFHFKLSFAVAAVYDRR
jgi:hypothetical protein